MNIFDWIVAGIAVAALLVIISLFVKYWRKLMLIDLDAMPKAKLRSKKYQLLESRLQRKMRSSVYSFFAPVKMRVAEAFKSTHDTLTTLERKYRHAAMTPKTQEDKEKTRQKIAALKEQATELFRKEQLGEAEAMFLEIIRLNPKEVEAYEYLGELYLQKREYEHAVETLEFAKTLSPEEDRIYYDLGMVYRTQGNAAEAYECFQKCVELAPNNPRNLDMMMSVAVERGERDAAKELLARFKEVNPDNEKIGEWEKTIADLKSQS